jgi:hypothetical protein
MQGLKGKIILNKSQYEMLQLSMKWHENADT